MTSLHNTEGRENEVQEMNATKRSLESMVGPLGCYDSTGIYSDNLLLMNLGIDFKTNQMEVAV